MSEMSRRQPVSFGTTFTRPDRVSAALSPSSPAVPPAGAQRIHHQTAAEHLRSRNVVNARLCEADHTHTSKNGMLTMHSKALRAPTSERAQKNGGRRAGTDHPIDRRSDDDNGRYVCNMLDGSAAGASHSPVPCPPLRSRYRRARDRVRSPAAIASAAIDVAGVCLQVLPGTGPGELRVGLDARRVPFAPRRGMQIAHCWRFLWRNAMRFIPAR